MNEDIRKLKIALADAERKALPDPAADDVAEEGRRIVQATGEAAVIRARLAAAQREAAANRARELNAEIRAHATARDAATAAADSADLAALEAVRALFEDDVAVAQGVERMRFARSRAAVAHRAAAEAAQNEMDVLETERRQLSEVTR